jgi:hypothetical protein
MDLQTNGGKPVTSGNVSPPDNFRAYSPQIADDRRRPPTTAGHPSEQFAFTASLHDVEPDASDPGHHGSDRVSAQLAQRLVVEVSSRCLAVTLS